MGHIWSWVGRLVLVAAAAACLVAAPRPAAASAVPLSISVSGNHFVNGAGRVIRLLGVNREGTEYACVQGTGYSVGPEDASDAAAVAAWHANAVRIPINEDCWLGINGLPAYGTAAGYRQMIESYVSALNSDGIYAILDLQWTAPGSYPANGLRTMPDDNSPAFWTSVASTFLDNPAVLFDVFNEPHSVSWSCWRDGGCSVPVAVDGSTSGSSGTYTAVGMQTLIDAIRATGARQPILLAGLNHGNDLSGWLQYMPHDPDGQLAASFHVYQPNACNTTSCWDSTVAPVAAVVPTTTIEFSEGDCTENWDNTLMDWDDAHGIGYLGWGWFILYVPNCENLFLITDWNGTPAYPNGTALRDHLAALAAATGGSSSAGGGSGSASGGSGSASAGSSAMGSSHAGPRLRWRWTRLTGKTFAIRLWSSQRVTGRVSALTANRLRVRIGRRIRRVRVALGSRRFSLTARRWRTISITPPPRARWLIASQRVVRADVSIVAAPVAGGDETSVARVVRVSG